MFFILSKVLFILLQPLNWIITLAIYALLTKKVNRKKRALRSIVFLLIVFTNPCIINMLINNWEVEAVKIKDLKQTYDFAIVLGGFSDPYMQPDDRLHFSDRANRLTNALELYHQGKVNKLLITGGSGNILRKEKKESFFVKDFLLRLNIPEEDIIIETESRNTRENALFTAEIIKEQYPNAKCLLVTSAFHTRRSKACFDKVGLDCTVFPTDFKASASMLHPNSLIIPDAKAFFKWKFIIKEWVGYIVYGMKGYL